MIKIQMGKINGRNNGCLIKVGDIVESWSSPYTIYLIKKELIDYELVETKTPIEIRGMVQNLTMQMLDIKPVGERNWRRYKIISTYHFKNDDLVEVDNQRFRVLGTDNENTYYGYYRYNLIEDYKEDEVPEEEEEEEIPEEEEEIPTEETTEEEGNEGNEEGTNEDN